jgi:hypothetical protein
MKRTLQRKRPNARPLAFTLNPDDLTGAALARVEFGTNGEANTWRCASRSCPEILALEVELGGTIYLDFCVFSKKEGLYVPLIAKSRFWPKTPHEREDFFRKMKNPAFRRSVAQYEQATRKKEELGPHSEIPRESLPIRVRCRQCGKVCILKNARFSEVQETELNTDIGHSEASSD